MKKPATPLILFAPILASAHPGHGTGNPLSPDHYVGNPEHSLPIALTVAAGIVVAIWAYLKIFQKETK